MGGAALNSSTPPPPTGCPWGPHPSVVDNQNCSPTLLGVSWEKKHPPLTPLGVGLDHGPTVGVWLGRREGQENLTNIPFSLVLGSVDSDIVQLFRGETHEEDCLPLKEFPMSSSLHFPGTLGSPSPLEPALTCSRARGHRPPFTVTDAITATHRCPSCFLQP